jgi:hypothetical protein
MQTSTAASNRPVLISSPNNAGQALRAPAQLPEAAGLNCDQQFFNIDVTLRFVSLKNRKCFSTQRPSNII